MPHPLPSGEGGIGAPLPLILRCAAEAPSKERRAFDQSSSGEGIGTVATSFHLRILPAMLTTLAISNYRSLRDLVVPLERLNVVTGANGSGKSSLYRSLRLLAETAQGGLVAALAREGGLQSTLWAGPERFSRGMKRSEQKVEGTTRRDSIHLRLGFSSDDFGYAIDLGLPVPSRSAFALDPEVKREVIWAGQVFRPASMLVDRRGPVLRATDAAGAWQIIPHTMSTFASMLSEFSDPRSAPEMVSVRERVRSWRFYDHFRTDVDAPARQPQVGTHTPVLADDGADLAAALQTVREIGDGEALDRAIEDAFPGAGLEVLQSRRALRGGHAAARAAAAAEGGRAFGRNAALSPPRRRAAHPAPARPHGAERAGDEPAPGPAPTARAPHRALPLSARRRSSSRIAKA